MHAEAYEGFGRVLALSGVDPESVKKGLDVGGADVNGTARGYFPNAEWTGLDISEGTAVDIVADAATWRSKRRYDAVIATELAEHAENWPAIVETMARHLGKNGPQLLLVTCASTGRPPHGSRGEWGVPAGQWYRNIPPDEMRELLEKYFHDVYVEYNPNPGDVYAYARGVKAL